MTWRPLGLILGLLGFTPPARALAQDVPLTLEEVLGSTRERYPGMEAARQGIATAEAELLAARGRFDTRIRTQGSVMPLGYYQRERLDAVIEQPLPLLGTRLFAGYRLGRGDFPVYYGEYETLTRGELRAGLELSLWRNGLVDPRRAGVSQARLRRELATFTFAGERLELQRSAAYQYWDWVAAGRRLRIAEAQYALAVARHEQLAQRVAAGDIPEIEHTENERVLLGRDAARVAARRALQRTALALSLYLRDARGEPHVVEPVRLPESIPVPETALEAELGTWIDRALRDRPELRELALQGEVLQVDVDLARNQAAPAVDLGLSVARDVGAGPDSLRPTEFQAGPSDQRAPVHSRWIGALGCRSPLNAGSTVRTSGSVKYVVGAPPEPKSRGGLVTVLGGAAGALAGACAIATRGITTAAPAATPMVFMSMRRDITPPRSPFQRSCAMAGPPPL